METIRQAFDFLARGGPMMALIALASVLCVALIIERFVFLKRKRMMPQRLLHEIHSLASEKKRSEILALAKANDAPVARILYAGLSTGLENKDDLTTALEVTGKREVHEMEKYLDFMGLLAAVGPLLGLLGTVTGMIRTFGVIRVVGVGDPLRLSGGIAEALISTAGGLVVGIIALVFQRYFYHRVDRFVLEMEEFVQNILDKLKAS